MLLPADAPLHAPERDRLGVLTTTLPVVRDAPQVTLHGEQAAAVAEAWAAQPWPEEYWDTSIHFFDGTERTLNWLALLDALNFCFWGGPTPNPSPRERGEGNTGERGEGNTGERSEGNNTELPLSIRSASEGWGGGRGVGPQPQRWRVFWRDRWYDGYDALAVALTRALDDGYPLWDAGFLMRLDTATLGAILRPDPDPQGNAVEIPLLAARLANAREVGRVLVERFGGQFAHVVESADHDAVTLALQIASAFPSFDDVAAWQGRETRLFKRAQILVGDSAAAFNGQSWGAFTNLGELTAFADYKVPQLLRRLNILSYSEELAARIDRYDLIAPGSPDEVAIRAATVWGVEWLRQALAAQGATVTPAAIDHRLWLAGQSAHQDDHPYHRTRTIFY